MARKRHKPEEIVSKLRQVDVLHSQGMAMTDAIRQIGVSEVTFYCWRKEYPNHVWSNDFVHKHTHDGHAFRTLNVIDEFTRECLAIRVKRKLSSIDVIDVLTDQFILRGPPAFVRSDNGP